jgi:hypothetical protein
METYSYVGKKPNAGREVNLGEKVVLDLLEGIDAAGHNVTYDNFFTIACKNVAGNKVTPVATIRKNKPELPPDMISTKKSKTFTTMFGFQQDCMFVSYCPKKSKIVNFLSTLHSEPKLNTSNEQRTPEVIPTYNDTKTGVDTMDQMTRTYSCKRKTGRWSLVVFYNLLNISAINAYVIWKALNPNWNSNKSHNRRLYLLQLGKELSVLSEVAIQKTIEHTRETASEPPRKQTRCTICPSTTDRKTKKVH